MVDIVVSVAAKVAEYLVAPVGRQCGYVIFTNSYVGQLKEELEKLDEVKVGVQRSVNDAENNMMEIRLEVNRWKNDAENSADKARGMLDNDGRATSKTCFCGWLPNPKERYFLGRDARKTAQAIQALIPQGKFERVYYERAPPGHVAGPSDVNLSAGDGGDTITDSQASIFQDILKALDDEKQKVIGVYGPGGVGKTTLLEEVEKKLKKEGRPFHMIVKAKVSQTPDLNKIQDDFAYFFGLHMKEPSVEGRRDILCKRLQNDSREKILIILDDLWKELDLREVGIPLGDESKGCKLLLTSRFKNVLEQMKCDTPVFHLEGLKDDEAFRLFEKTVGERLKDDEELKAIAPKVVKKLAGLPLLIISVACSLKDRDVDAWRIALKKIDLSKMETIVKLSYDHLKSEDTKTLFLLCGLIGGTIQVEILLVLGISLGLFEEFGRTIQDSRAGLNAMLDELRSVCLLLDGGDDKNNVTIHDLYGEVVSSTPFGGQNSLMMNSNYGYWPKEKLEKCWAICQVNVGRDRLDKLMECHFADLKILMLSQPPKWYWIPEHLLDMGDHLGLLDFTYMKELRVLYLCSMRITSLHSSIRILGNLQSLYFKNCNVEDVAILGNLKALQILSFAGSTISRLPKEIGDLTNLRLLNLNYCNKLKIIEPDALKCLTNLEELHMMGSFDRWMGKNEKPSELCNAGLAELRSMTKLNYLEISIRDPIILLEVDDLPVENLTRFWINIGNVGKREFKGLRTMKIKLEGHDSILSKTWVQKTLQKTQYLCLDGLGEFENAYELCIQGFPQLKHLDIQNCPSIKYIVSSSNSAFAILESLFLNNLINLEKISHGHIVAECFSKLKFVRVEKCNRLEYLWNLSNIQNLAQLEEIGVWNCNSMRGIARKDTVPIDCRVELPYLSHLYLANLPNMRSFCSRAKMTSEGTPIQAGVVDEGGGDEGIELVTTTSDLQNTYSDSFFDRKASLPNLEKLKLNSVGSFKRIWHDELSISSFCKLATITVKNCYDLLHIFPSTIIGRLHKLESVKVLNCPSLKSLFDFGSLDSNTEQNTVLLPELVRINIERCPSLELLFNCGSLDSYAEHKIISLPNLEELRMKEVFLEKEAGRSEAKAMSFPCLSKLTLKELDNFGAFIPSPTSVKRQLSKMAEENDESSQLLFNEMVTSPNITSLEIKGLRCKELWNDQIPTNSFQKLEYLKLKNCDNLQHIATSYMWKKLQRCLEILEVISCHSIEIIYEGDGTDTKSGKLRRLVLGDLENLRCIWQSDSLPNISFPNLRYIKVVRCSRLEMLFPTFIAKFLGQIEEPVVESCEDMELIASHEKWEEATGTTTTFSKLAALRLFKLPKFKSFLHEKYSLKFSCSKDFPSLRVLSMESCGAEPDQVLGDWCGREIKRALRAQYYKIRAIA